MSNPAPSADKSPAGALLDLALFAPLGLAITLGEAIPELARKGRSRLEPRLGSARAVGELAVGQGRQRLEGFAPGNVPNPFRGGVPNPFKGGLPFGLSLKGFPLGPFGPPIGRRSAPYPGASASGSFTRNGRAPSTRTRPASSRGTVAGAGSDGPAGAERPIRPVVRRPSDVESAGGHGSSSNSAPGHTTRAGRAAVVAADLAIPSYDALSASQVVQRLAGLSRPEIKAVRAYEAATRGRRTILAKADQLLS